jgi:hypothetical protein
MKKMKISMYCILVVILMSLLVSTSFAVDPSLDPFPIGIFWPPSPEDTSYSTYQDIADMNATFVLMGNGNNNFTENDGALTYAASNGLKVIVDDERLVWNTIQVEQKSTGHGKYVSNSNSLGQTVISPWGTGWGLNKVKIYIDKNYWPSNVSLTLSVYDSPSKTTLIGSDTITGPVDTYYPEFAIHKAVSQHTTYYLELTSDNPTSVGWVVTSLTDTYTDGMAYENGVAQLGYDFWFDVEFAQRMYNDSSQPSNSDIDDVVNHYKNNSALYGYNIFDEPGANTYSRIQATIDRIRSTDSNNITYVNLFPSYAATSQLGLDNVNGGPVTPSSPFGQTFKTNSVTTTISTIQLYIDKTTWGTNEPLTLKLWDSSDKTSLIAQDTMNGSSTNYPIFNLDTSVSANTSYYFELTHNGGGDNTVGWVIRSSDGVDWVPYGTAYINGGSIDADLWFTINQNITALTFEDYVYKWASLKPDFLMYDHYPFLENNQFSTTYYSDMEIIRRQALAQSVPFWTYIQSCGITGFMRAPNTAEMRYHVYTSLAYGAKGYSYFLYSTPSGDGFHSGIILADGTKNTALYNGATSINGEVKKLGPVLKELTSIDVYHTGTLPASTTQLPTNFYWQVTNSNDPVIVGSFQDSNGRKYIMVVNRDFSNSRMISFTLSSKPSNVTEVSKSTGLEVNTNYNSSTGVLSSNFEAGEGRLYALPISY